LRQSRYRGRLAARLWRHRLGPLPAGIAALALALAAGGCTYQLDSMLSKDDADVTGSIRSPAPQMAATLPPHDDLAIARAAVSELLARGGKDTSMPWENPRTGARGTITPIASAYSQDGETCRDFLASYVRNGTEAWLQGEACRSQQGGWEVRHMKPWKRT
jgi:surface antigen